MLNIFEKLYNSNEIACFYFDCNDTKSFYVGIILAYNDREIALQLVSTDGTDDGIEVMDINNIFRVEMKGQYIKKIKKLSSDLSKSKLSIELKNDDIFKSILETALESKKIVSLELSNSGFSDVVGFVDTLYENECKIKQVDEYGYEDGYSYLKIDEITGISYSRMTEQRLMKLWEIQ